MKHLKLLGLLVGLLIIALIPLSLSASRQTTTVQNASNVTLHTAGGIFGTWDELRMAPEGGSWSGGERMNISYATAEDFGYTYNARTIYSFQPLSIPKDAKIRSAKLHVYGHDKENLDYADISLALVAVKSLSYDGFTTKELAARIPYDDYNLQTYNAFTLNRDGIKNISMEKPFHFMALEGTYDLDGKNIALAELGPFVAEYANHPPYLEVVWK